MASHSKIFLIVGCAIAIPAGILAYLFQNKKPKNYMIEVEILSKESFIEICLNMRKEYSKSFWQAFKTCRTERRKYPLGSEQYERAVKNFQNEAKGIMFDVMNQVTKSYRISKEVFENSVNYYDSFSELKQYPQDIFNHYYPEKITSKLTKEQVIELMKYYSKRFAEVNAEYLDVDDFLVVACQVHDEIYSIYKIEEEELSNEYEKYKEEIEVENVVEPLKFQTSYILNSVDDSFEN